MNERLFRDAMGKFATGITIVTMEDETGPRGMTVNAFMSLSLDPMLIAVSIDEKASMYEALQQTDKFGVSILKDSQVDYSRYFARQIDLEEEVNYTYQDDVPVLSEALATVTCRVQQQIKAGDHMIFIGEVTAIQINEGKPLIFFGGNYRYLQD